MVWRELEAPEVLLILLSPVVDAILKDPMIVVSEANTDAVLRLVVARGTVSNAIWAQADSKQIMDVSFSALARMGEFLFCVIINAL